MKYLVASIMIAMACWSCHPEPEAYDLLDQMVVSTNYDTTAVFSSYRTYSLPTDTIGYISDTDRNDTIRTSPQYNLPRGVLKAVEANMNKYGYERLPQGQSADIGVNVYAVKNLNLFQQVIYPNYYYSGYYGYGGYNYYPYVQTYAFNTGSLVVEFVDLKNAAANSKYKVIWNAYMGDLFNTARDETEESVDAVNQAFDQSPYLKLP
ncbi:MAG TPA: DUF4136 domain-containing protein [Ohtaekwangia sp.]|uniref:DUF4136 domain-containing protein n=1 Tax=Ohtaekwangia sp. TaxID=2066019 RepID=UPI002F92DC45